MTEQNLQIITSLVVPEQNNADSNADDETPQSGLFLVPSPNVPDRATDITGYFVTVADANGKLQLSDSDGLVSLATLSDVTLTTPAANDVLTYDGAEWVNGTTVTLTSVTSTDAAFGTATTDLIGFYGTAAIAQPAVSAVDTTFVANTSGITDGTATYLGYTVEGIVTNLQALGLLA